MGNKILIQGGLVIDPIAKTEAIRDIKIEKQLFVEEFSDDKGITIVDATGLIVTPGLVDMHVHLREPGREDEETIRSGARAACAGGFTTIVCMPNTNPCVDNRAVLEYILDRAANVPCGVKVVGSTSVDQAGRCLSDMGDLADAGAVAFSDDGLPIKDSALMRRALEYSGVFGLPIICHAEDTGLSDGGVMNEGPTAASLGLKGIPAAAEEIMVARDIILAELTGGRLHITHVSTAGSVDLIRSAKKRGVRVSADVTPHHLVLTDENMKGYDTNYKINPPLRGEAEKKALFEGLVDGTIDAIVSDHAPHALHEKEQEIERAPFGTIGLQTTLPVVMTYLAKTKLGLSGLISKLTRGPAQILGLEAGTFEIGNQADVAIIDPEAKVKIEPSYFLSKSNNSAFLGLELVGRASNVIFQGKIVLKERELIV
ncbi:MAG TPA: dihydroorotase [Actinobacteria bacterium]|nr:dihydroorotase [Actinomycetota bacterium]